MAPKAKQVKQDLTLADILKLAPAVEAVIRRARYYRRSDWHAYERSKAEISIYVGWFAKNPALRPSYCYELAIAALFGAMGRPPKRRGRGR